MSRFSRWGRRESTDMYTEAPSPRLEWASVSSIRREYGDDCHLGETVLDRHEPSPSPDGDPLALLREAEEAVRR